MMTNGIICSCTHQLDTRMQGLGWDAAAIKVELILSLIAISPQSILFGLLKQTLFSTEEATKYLEAC